MAFDTLSEKRKRILFTLMFGVIAAALVLFIVLEIVILSKGGFPFTPDKPSEIIEATEEPTAEPTEEPTEEPWIYINEDCNTIETRFNPPKGYTRVEVEPGSFAEYLRTYPLKDYGALPLQFSGAINDEASALGVLAQPDPLIRNQQCADTVIMLYAEYLYGQGRFDEISFNFLNGFKCDFKTWAAGYRDKVSGNKVEWVLSTDKPGVVENDYSYENLYNYLKEVYVYANTDSLALELPFVKPDDLKIGDVLIGTVKDLKEMALNISDKLAESINYGHAILIADMAVNEAGEKVYLFIEGTTPATECTVVQNPTISNVCWFYFRTADNTFQKGTSGIRWRTTWGHSLDKSAK
ncbi:MAG: hypothetical protein J6112_00060 [Clostridia bacterium]|nr:hypothetical protein [Clostridia bacterium]